MHAHSCQRRRPEQTLFYTLFEEYYPAFAESMACDGRAEIAQVFIAGRYPDGTDVVVAVAAAWLVMVLLDRCDADVPAHLNSGGHSRRISAPK